MARRSAAADLPKPTRLKVAIIESGHPQFFFARALRISPFRMSRIVRARQRPTDDEQDQLSDLLNVPRRALFTVVVKGGEE